MKPLLQSTAAIRAITYSVVAFLAFLALQAAPKRASRPVHMLSAPVTVPTEQTDIDTVKYGETLARLLMRRGLTPAQASSVLRASPLDARKVPAGMEVTLRGELDSVPNEIILHASPEKLYRLRRTLDGWIGESEDIPWSTDTLVAHGMVRTNLVHAFQASDALPPDARAELAYAVADIFEYRVDMSRDLRVGDSIHVLFERLTHPTAGVRIGKVLGANLRLSGTVTEAVRFDGLGHTEYFDQEGKSLRAAFLRAPLAFRRISSVFGMRKHPILGTFRRHAGTDYAAASGTPVRTVGNGVVIHAGWRGGYGNTVEIRHPNGFVSRYGHLRGFSSAAKRGAHVSIGQTIGYVGTTGLSSGPHLHFEVLVNGQQRDPRIALKQKGGDPVPASKRSDFEQVRVALQTMFMMRPDVVALSTTGQ